MSEGEPGARIRNADEADVPQMVEVLLRAFRGWPAFEIEVPAVEHLRWKMRSDPMAPRNQWVTEVDGRIAGLSLAIVRRVRMRGQDYLVRDGVDAAVDPGYQGRRLYSSMADELESTPQTAEFDLGAALENIEFKIVGNIEGQVDLDLGLAAAEHFFENGHEI